ncbi:3-isopropylmalate dehydrogenase [Corynebacterium sp. HMSC064E07]|uniref:isocitrate/isopropylmalate dehydrogenase family protein n=1 Tax=Corynebacterium sp. HMSC064E07 TaxID=1739545 RepID=UPI0008A468F1|nr:isocitrate/isopropylmalate family dehydrogenase [Corynebacterium sp. HMSC064E07]OFO26345.1 3-isopropylmalate dehydrogenase [Corynebacterium sp. HMSC064E07]
METDQPATANDAAPRRITLLPGDGIGPEITDACRGLIADVFPHWELTEAQIGWSQWCAHGNPVPQETWETLGRSDAALLAAITSKPAREAEEELAPHLRDTGLTYRSPVLQLRQRLDLFANIRPVTLPGAAADFTIVRENTEGLYSHDYLLPPYDTPTDSPHHHLWAEVAEDSTVARAVDKRGDVAISLRVTTSFAWHRLARQAAKLALARQAANPDSEATPTVTVADKPNILRDSARVIRGAVEEVAEEYPQVAFDFANADAVAMQLVTDPARFDVIIAENLIGDILSDIGAGLIGGLGLAASANVGDDFAVFEPVHGSAPDIAGRGIANPAAFLLSAAMCAEHLGHPTSELAPAAKLREAVYAVTRTAPTPDLGGTATTSEFVAAVRAELGL